MFQCGRREDTTALSLALSILLITLNHLVERYGHSLLDRTEAEARRRLAYRYQAGDPASEPYLAAVRAMGETVVRHTADLVQRQTALWATTVEKINERAGETFAQLSAETRRQGERADQTAAVLAESERRLGETIAGLADLLGGRAELFELQRQLAANLETLRQTQQFDEAVNSLTAAIHLLAVRRTPGSAAA